MKDLPRAHEGLRQEITDPKQAEQKLYANEERLRMVADMTYDWEYWRGTDNRFIYMSPSCENVTGYSREEFMQDPDLYIRIAHQEDRERLARHMREDLLHDEPGELEFRITHRNGQERWIAHVCRSMRDANGNDLGRRGSNRDITERKRADEAFRQSEARFRTLFETMTEGFALHEIVVDDHGRSCDYRFLDVNPAFERLTGLKRPDLIGKRVLEILPDLEPQWIERYGRVALTGEPLHIEDYSADLGRWYEVLAYRVAPRQFAVVFSNITERKQAEEALRVSEQRLQLAWRATRDVIWDWDVVNDAQRWSGAGVEVFGWTDIVESPQTAAWWSDRVHPDDRERVTEEFHRVLADPSREQWQDEYRFFRRDGSIANVLDRGFVLRDASGKPTRMIGAMQDITERKRAEEELFASNQRLTSLMSALPVGVSFSDDITCQRITGNPAVLAQFEITTSDNLSASAADQNAPGRQVRFFCDGRPITDADLPLQRAVAEKREIPPLELEVRLPSGRHWFTMASGAPIRDRTGDVIGGVAVTVDITERKRAEEELAAEKRAAEQAQITAEAANRTKDQFLANMSHELRTPMNAILGMIDVALPKVIEPIVRDCLQTAKESGGLLLTLLDDLLDSSKIASGKLELEVAPFSLRRMLDQITRVLSVRASEKGLCLYCRILPETPDAVTGDRMRLQQVLLNLVGNAIKFTERGEVEISLRGHSDNGEACLEFAVRDTGIGIPSEGLSRLFQPFSQADPSMTRRFGGTGLGLSICKGLVELMAGRIWVESEVGKGSSFYFSIRLPLPKELPSDFEAPDARPVAACPPLRILLVEDNPANQKLATYILQDRGHLVEIARDGYEALCLSERNRYDVILMDVQMPGMNGLEATAAIRRREDGARVPILAMTAHAIQGDRERCLAAGMDGYLSKPVNAQEMIGLVESTARGSAPGASLAAATREAIQASSAAAPLVFHPAEALAQCFNSRDMVQEMIQCFYDEVESMFPQMRAALEKGDLEEIGRLGHRMKGTIVYLGAQRAKEAALGVERFCKSNTGTPAEARAAIHAFEQECLVLKAALLAQN